MQESRRSEDLFAESAPATDMDARLAQFADLPRGGDAYHSHQIDLLLDVGMTLAVELGRAEMMVKELLSLGPGSVVELDKLAGEPADILINGTLIGVGEIVVVDDKFSIRITELRRDVSDRL